MTTTAARRSEKEGGGGGTPLFSAARIVRLHLSRPKNTKSLSILKTRAVVLVSCCDDWLLYRLRTLQEYQVCIRTSVVWF